MTSFSAGWPGKQPTLWVSFVLLCLRPVGRLSHGCFTGWLSCGAVVATPRPGVSAAVYLAAYLLVCWLKAAADCGDGVSLHVVSGFLTLWLNAAVCAEISDIVMSFMTNKNAHVGFFWSLWKTLEVIECICMRCFSWCEAPDMWKSSWRSPVCWFLIGPLGKSPPTHEL